MECQGCWWWLEGGVAAAAAGLVALVIDPELVPVPLMMVGLMFVRQGRREEGAWAVEQGWLLVLVVRAVFEDQSEPACCVLLVLVVLLHQEDVVEDEVAEETDEWRKGGELLDVQQDWCPDGFGVARMECRNN